MKLKTQNRKTVFNFAVVKHLSRISKNNYILNLN